MRFRKLVLYIIFILFFSIRFLINLGKSIVSAFFLAYNKKVARELDKFCETFFKYGKSFLYFVFLRYCPNFYTNIIDDDNFIFCEIYFFLFCRVSSDNEFILIS